MLPTDKKRIVIDVFVILKSGTEVPIIIFFCNDRIVGGVTRCTRHYLEDLCRVFKRPNEPVGHLIPHHSVCSSDDRG